MTYDNQDTITALAIFFIVTIAIIAMTLNLVGCETSSSTCVGNCNDEEPSKEYHVVCPDSPPTPYEQCISYLESAWEAKQSRLNEMRWVCTKAECDISGNDIAKIMEFDTVNCLEFLHPLYRQE